MVLKKLAARVQPTQNPTTVMLLFVLCFPVELIPDTATHGYITRHEPCWQFLLSPQHLINVKIIYSLKIIIYITLEDDECIYILKFKN